MRKCKFVVGLVLAVSIVVALATAQRPTPSGLGVDPTVAGMSGLKGGTFVMNARDTALTESFKLVSQQAFTQMAVADSVRIISTSTADSAMVWIVGIGTDSLRHSSSYEVSGTDTVRIQGLQYRYLEAVYPDTECAATVTVHRKIGATTIVALAANDMAASPAHHFFSHTGGGLFGWEAKIDPESPVVHLQLRLYREHLDAVHTPETGYVVLDEMYVGGTAAYHPQVTKTIVTSANDTSSTFSIVGAEKVGYAAVITSTGTSNTATYLDVSPDRSNWKQTAGVDSYNATGVSGTVVRAKPLVVDSLYGQPWARIIVNGKGGAGDTTTINTYVTVHRNSGVGDRDARAFSVPEGCPGLSYVAVYARALGKNGRVFVRLKGYDNPVARK